MSADEEHRNALAQATFDGRDYSEIFSDDFFILLCRQMDIAPDQQNIHELRKGHLQAIRHYYEAKVELERRRSLKEENARLNRVARDAERLWSSLVQLFEFGDAQAKLAEEVRNNPTACRTQSGQQLADLLETGTGQPFLSLQSFLSDLAASAERAQARTADTPKAECAKLRAAIRSKDRDALAKLVLEMKLPPTTDLRNVRSSYRIRSTPLLAFIAAFEPVWSALSSRKFASGYRAPDGEEPKSRAINAISLTFERFGDRFERKEIDTALRNWKRIKPEVS